MCCSDVGFVYNDLYILFVWMDEVMGFGMVFFDGVIIVLKKL